jgi:hypothetical protein
MEYLIGLDIGTQTQPLAPCLIWMDRRAEKEVRFSPGSWYLLTRFWAG